MPSWRRLLLQLMRFADSRTFWIAGTRIAIRTAITARTTSSSVKVIPWRTAELSLADIERDSKEVRKKKKIDLVIVGSDRTLGHTGEVANKIGTYTQAVLAHRHGIPFYVALPLSTLDWQLRSGRAIPIEERDPGEVLGAWGVISNLKAESRNLKRGTRAYVRVANPTSTARNPAFDITPPELITGLITPRGIFRPSELWAQRRLLQP